MLRGLPEGRRNSGLCCPPRAEVVQTVPAPDRGLVVCPQAQLVVLSILSAAISGAVMRLGETQRPSGVVALAVAVGPDPAEGRSSVVEVGAPAVVVRVCSADLVDLV